MQSCSVDSLVTRGALKWFCVTDIPIVKTSSNVTESACDALDSSWSRGAGLTGEDTEDTADDYCVSGIGRIEGLALLATILSMVAEQGWWMDGWVKKRSMGQAAFRR